MTVSFVGDALQLPQVNAAAAIAATEREARVVLREGGSAGADHLKARTRDRSGNLDRSVIVRTKLFTQGDHGLRMSFGPNRNVAFMSRKGSRETRLEGGAGGQVRKQRAFYAWFVEEGTGIHGPRRQPIRRRGLMPVGGGARVPSGQGQPAQRVFINAYDHYRGAIAPAVDRKVQAIAEQRIQAQVAGRVSGAR